MRGQHTTWGRPAGLEKDFVEDPPVQSKKTLPVGDWANIVVGEGPPQRWIIPLYLQSARLAPGFGSFENFLKWKPKRFPCPTRINFSVMTMHSLVLMVKNKYLIGTLKYIARNTHLEQNREEGQNRKHFWLY